MRLSKKLIELSTSDPTKDSRQRSIKDLCSDIENKRIILPIFQTFIRWNIEKSVSLLNFQLFGKAPVSPISVNLIQNPEIAVPQVTFIERIPVAIEKLSEKMSVNDGQQRLSCNYKAYTNHEDFKNIYLDLSRGVFVENKDERRKSQIPVGILYNKDEMTYKKYIKEHKEFQSFEVNSLLTDVRKKFFSYYYTVNVAIDLSDAEQQEWFDVLNRAGSRVTDVEMDLVGLMGKGIDFYSEYSTPFYDKLEEYEFDDLFIQKSTEVTIPVACLNPSYEVFYKKEHSKNLCPIASDRKPKLIAKIENPSEIRKLFSMTLNGLEEALEFMEENTMILKTPDKIDYITYLVGFFVYKQGKTLSDLQKNKLIDWFNNVNFNVKGDNTIRRDKFTELLNILE